MWQFLKRHKHDWDSKVFEPYFREEDDMYVLGHASVICSCGRGDYWPFGADETLARLRRIDEHKKC